MRQFNLGKAFKSSKVKVPTAVKVGKGKATIFFPFDEMVYEDIEFCRGLCGCTANVHWSSKGVTAYYEDQNTVESLDGAQSVTQVKSINVYLKDDKPLKTFNENGVEVFNDDGPDAKSKVIITFEITVSL